MLAARPPRLMLQHHRPLSLSLLVVLVLILLVGRCSASANATVFFFTIFFTVTYVGNLWCLFSSFLVRFLALNHDLFRILII